MTTRAARAMRARAYPKLAALGMMRRAGKLVWLRTRPWMRRTWRHRFFALLVLVLRTAGRAAFARAALLSGDCDGVDDRLCTQNAMMASDVTDLAQSSIGFRIVLWFRVASGGDSGGACGAVGNRRCFGGGACLIPRLQFLSRRDLCSAACRAAAWQILRQRGERLLAGIAVLCVNMSLHSCGFPDRAICRRGLSFSDCRSQCVCRFLCQFFCRCLCSCGLVFAAGVLAAPHHLLVTHRPAVFGPALALALTYLVTLWRAHAALFVRVLASAVRRPDFLLALRNNQITSASLQNTISLGVLVSDAALVCLGWPVRLCTVHSMPIGCSRSVSATEGFACWRRSVRFRSAA